MIVDLKINGVKITEEYLKTLKASQRALMLAKVVDLFGGMDVSGAYGATSYVSGEDISGDDQTNEIWLHSGICTG